METIYLVRKDPQKEAGEENWTVMNGAEFSAFMRTEEGRKRRRGFGRIEACGQGDRLIVAECGEETAVKWKAESDRSRYLEIQRKRYMNARYGPAVRSDDGQARNREACDRSVDVEDTVISELMVRKLREALRMLPDADRDLVEKLYLAGRQMTEREYAARLGICRTGVHYRKDRILRKLKATLEKEEETGGRIKAAE